LNRRHLPTAHKPPAESRGSPRHPRYKI